MLDTLIPHTILNSVVCNLGKQRKGKEDAVSEARGRGGMCLVRGRWPSSSCTTSCHTVGTSKGSSHRASRAAFHLPLNRCTSLLLTASSFSEAHLRSFPINSIDSLPPLASAILPGASFFEGTALVVMNKSRRRMSKRCRVVVTSVMTPPSTNLQRRAAGEAEPSGTWKGNDEELPETLHLELRKPGHVVRSDIKEVHHVELPVIGLNVRPKVQVRPKRALGKNSNSIAKVPRLLNAHREARPRFSTAIACSPEMQSLVASLRRSWRQTHSIEDVIVNHPRSLSPFDITCVLTELQRQHDWQCTLELFSWSKKQQWYRPNSRLYTRLIGFLGREGQVHRATLLFQEMLLEKCQVDQYTYTAMVNSYGKARMVDEALAVFNHMKECPEPNCQPNVVTCNALIDALVKGGRHDHAIETFMDMRDGTNGLEHGCKPNVITYNTLIDALCREGMVDIGIRVLQSMREGEPEQRVPPNSATYNTVIDACGKGGLYEKAEDLLEDMVQHGVQPDHITYTALIHSYGKAGLWECAENTFKGMKGAHVTIDVMAYTAMIDAYAKEGLFQKAEALFKAMQHSGIRPNQVTFLSLIDAYGKAGLPEEAKNACDEMQAAGYEANVLIYSSLVDAYGKAGNYLKAAQMVNLMRRAGCQPNLITYAAILSSCGRSKSWDEAQVLLQSLQASNSEMENTLYKLVAGGPLSDSLWEGVSKMFGDLTRQPKVNQMSFCNSLLDILWNWGLGERASRVLSLTKEKGVYDDTFFVFTKSEWCLDLHRLSVGAAVTMLLVWLEELRLAWVWGEDAPEEVVIITGKGTHSKLKISALKAPVDVLLAQLCAPFTDVVGNCGRVTASGDAVQNWLLSPGIAQRLGLMDSSSFLQHC